MEEWQRPFVEAVIQHHNSTYSTHITIIDRCEFFYPALRGDQRWDWVCMDDVANTKIAVEIKRLMKENLKERDALLLHEIGIPLQDSLRGKLPGTFALQLGMKESELSLKGKRKTELLSALEREIIEVAPDLKLRESYQLVEKITPELRAGLSVSLTKVSNSNSKLRRRLTFTRFGVLLTGNKLRMNFRKLVQNANRQLGIARNMDIHETFLIVIMDEYGHSSVQELQDVLRGLAPSDHSNIGFCYLHDCWEGSQPALLADWSGGKILKFGEASLGGKHS
jgi:hypothetical protein